VQGQGTTDELTTYDFVDPHVIEGINYYRLTQVDLNGKNTVVGTIALSYSSIAENLEVFPNPANESITVKFESESTEIGQLFVLDNSGRIIQSTDHPLKKGSNNLYVDVRHLKPGNYFIYLSISQRNTSARFIKK